MTKIRIEKVYAIQKTINQKDISNHGKKLLVRLKISVLVLANRVSKNLLTARVTFRQFHQCFTSEFFVRNFGAKKNKSAFL